MKGEGKGACMPTPPPPPTPIKIIAALTMHRDFVIIWAPFSSGPLLMLSSKFPTCNLINQNTLYYGHQDTSLIKIQLKSGHLVIGKFPIVYHRNEAIWPCGCCSSSMFLDNCTPYGVKEIHFYQRLSTT